MKKCLSVIFILLLLTFSVVPFTVSAGTNNVVIVFSTEGPDKYADGSVVRDGECYALVWTPAGEVFQGLDPDGNVIGNSKLVVKAPIAKGGRCPNVQFQIDEETASKNYPGGTWGVYLLDTRAGAGGKKVVGVGGNNAAGIGGAALGCIKIKDAVAPYFTPAGAKGGIVQNLPAGIQPPTIRDFQVIGGMAYLFLQSMSPAVSYGIQAGQAPGSFSPVSGQPVLGGGSEELIIITPASGATGFFSPVIQTTYSAGSIWIILSIAVAFVLSVVVIFLVKRKKDPALAGGTGSKAEEKEEA